MTNTVITYTLTTPSAFHTVAFTSTITNTKPVNHNVPRNPRSKKYADIQLYMRIPTENDIIHATHTAIYADRLDITLDDCIKTWHRQSTPNPFAQGCFRAYHYILHNLIPSNDFPTKEPGNIKNIQDSHASLFWLRDIHDKMTTPLIKHGLLLDDQNAPTNSQIGKYRTTQTAVGPKPCPQPSLIPQLMHNWLCDYSNFHQQIKNKINNPYAISKKEAEDIFQKTYEVNLFFCTVQPLTCLNQRMGKVLENTFRLAWNLPMKNYNPNSIESRNLPPHILQFYDETLIPKLLPLSLSVK